MSTIIAIVLCFWSGKKATRVRRNTTMHAWTLCWMHRRERENEWCGNGRGWIAWCEAGKRECMRTCSEWQSTADQRHTHTQAVSVPASAAPRRPRCWLKNRSRRGPMDELQPPWESCARPSSVRPSPMTNAIPSIQRTSQIFWFSCRLILVLFFHV